MGYISAQQTRYSHLISGFLLFAILLFSAGSANAAVINQCNDCHGMPPKDGARKSSPHFRSYSSATVGSHQKHLTATPVQNDCVVCHGTAVTTFDHQNDSINMALPLSGGSYGKPVFFNQTSIPVLNSTATCSNVSCHADPYSAGTVTTPIWGTSAANCTACHTTPIGTNGPATGSHTNTAGHAVVCISCHEANTTATVAPTVGHADGNIDIANVGYATLNKTKGTPGTTCSAASCHASPVAATLIPTPAWGSINNGCAACHSGLNAIVANGPATGSHGISGGGHNVACTSCHAAGTSQTVAPSTGHVDGNIDVANVGYATLNKTKGTAGVSCSTAVCHGSSSPAWGANTTSVTCTKCHGKATVLANYSSSTGRQAAPGYAQSAGAPYTNGVSATAAYGAHDAHIRAVNQYTTRVTTCSDCHGTLPATSAHANGTTNFAWSNLAKNVGTTFAARATLNPGYASGTCSAVYCHGDGGVFLGTQGTDTTPVWTDQAYLTAYAKNVTNCGKCHAALPVVPSKDHSAIAYTAGTCNSCHGHDGNGVNHIDGTLQAAGDCNSCHDYDSVGSVWTGATTNRYTTTGTWGKNAISAGNTGFGAHAKHINYIKARLSISTALVATNQTFGVGDNKFVCGTCHTVLEVNHNSASNPNRSINFNDGGNLLGPSHPTQQSSLLYLTGTNPSYNYDTTAGTGTRTCSNMSCHYFTSPAWSN
ncbi:MAG: CxxxxCH/CxxCH domain c-type cytochrome [Desulfuromonadaceae bacterium]